MKKILLAMIVATAVYGQSLAQTNTISTTGNVGIGTTSPTQLLSVGSSSQFTVNNSGLVSINTPAAQLQLNSNTGSGISWALTSYLDGNLYLANLNTGANNVTFLPGGNVGIGTSSPGNSLSFKSVLDDSGTSGITWHSPDPLWYGIYKSAGSWAGPDYPRLTLAWSAGIVMNPGLGQTRSFVDIQGDGLRVTDGQLGVGTTAPVSLFQVDDGCTKASIGDASGGGLNYGTSYLGFNASRSGTSWFTNGDGGNNGGGVMYSSIFGDMYFATVPTTGGTGQTLSDQTIANNIALKISHLDGAVYAKKIYVQLTGFPDYVFNKDYQLMPLSSVKSYIDKNHHLPEMPTDKEVEAKGLDVGEMNKLLTKKVEELTLYLIDLKAEKDKKEAALEEANKAQKALLNDQEVRLKRLEATIQQIINK